MPSVVETLSFGNFSKTPPQIRKVSGRATNQSTSER